MKKAERKKAKDKKKNDKKAKERDIKTLDELSKQDFLKNPDLVDFDFGDDEGTTSDESDEESGLNWSKNPLDDDNVDKLKLLKRTLVISPSELDTRRVRSRSSSQLE